MESGISPEASTGKMGAARLAHRKNPRRFYRQRANVFSSSRDREAAIPLGSTAGQLKKGVAVGGISAVAPADFPPGELTPIGEVAVSGDLRMDQREMQPDRAVTRCRN